MENNRLSQEEEALLNSVLETEHQEIPVNPKILEVDDSTVRFSGAIWYEEIQKQTIIVAGVGGIGSFVAFLLSRLKPKNIIMYDPDKVERVNMAGQLYKVQDTGYYKVDAIANTIMAYSDYYNLIAYKQCYSNAYKKHDIMMCGFDNMDARKLFYTTWLKHVSNMPEEARKKCLYMDGRLAAEEFQVLSIQGDDTRAMEEYESKWLFDDSEAEETVCSYKQTTFMSNMIASVMVNVFVNFIANQCNPIINREVPFLITYDASTMFTKTVL